MENPGSEADMQAITELVQAAGEPLVEESPAPEVERGSSTGSADSNPVTVMRSEDIVLRDHGVGPLGIENSR
jgi:hypothetical protein